MTANRAISAIGTRFALPVSSFRARQRARIAKVTASTSVGIKPPAKRAAMEIPVTEPIVISTREGGIVSLIALDAARGDEFTLFDPAALHFGKQRGRDGRHVGCLGPGDSGYEIHGRKEYVTKTPANMTNERGEEPDHGPGHTCYLDEEAQKDEKRYRKQNQRAHSFVHA